MYRLITAGTMEHWVYDRQVRWEGRERVKWRWEPESSGCTAGRCSVRRSDGRSQRQAVAKRGVGTLNAKRGGQVAKAQLAKEVVDDTSVTRLFTQVAPPRFPLSLSFLSLAISFPLPSQFLLLHSIPLPSRAKG